MHYIDKAIRNQAVLFFGLQKDIISPSAKPFSYGRLSFRGSSNPQHNLPKGIKILTYEFISLMCFWCQRYLVIKRCIQNFLNVIYILKTTWEKIWIFQTNGKNKKALKIINFVTNQILIPFYLLEPIPHFCEQFVRRDSIG